MLITRSLLFFNLRLARLFFKKVLPSWCAVVCNNDGGAISDCQILPYFDARRTKGILKKVISICNWSN